MCNSDCQIPCVIGVDSYNLSTTGDMARYLCAERVDNEHLPCAIIFNMLQDPVSGDKVAPCLTAGNSKTGQCSLAIAARGGIGIDLYNQSVTGNKTQCICGQRCDNQNIPCVIISTIIKEDKKQ